MACRVTVVLAISVRGDSAARMWHANTSYRMLYVVACNRTAIDTFFKRKGCKCHEVNSSNEEIERFEW
jgi:hypothetical protein